MWESCTWRRSPTSSRSSAHLAAGYNRIMAAVHDDIPASLLDQAYEEARLAGLVLSHDERGYFLSDGAMSVRGDFSRMLPRISPNALNRELVVKTAHIKGATAPLRIFDATAGLGEDSFLLAAAGHTVSLCERNPIIAVLLLSALSKAGSDHALADAARRMSASCSDGVLTLQRLDAAPDVVLLDPMFPERRKSAAVKKKLQLLQRLERPCEDEQELLDAAFAAHPRKVIVKRPVKGPYLAGRKPDYTLSGKAIRFDCYSLPR